jgi:hypothetical protein
MYLIGKAQAHRKNANEFIWQVDTCWKEKGRGVLLNNPWEK